jgi:signal transduction histidine kinase
MSEPAQHVGGVAPLSRRQRVGDLLLGLALTALVLPIGLSGVEAVPANVPPGPLLVVLTVVAVLPVVVRRRFPLSVLVVTLLALLALVVTRNVVAFATLGPLVASYTAVAYQSRRRAGIATAILVVGFTIGGVLRPVDLSLEGAVVQAIVFVGGWLLANGTRERRELFLVGLDQAQHEAARERDRADAERERARRIATEERLRISREVHDVVGHAMSVVVVQAGVADQLVETRPDQARLAIAEIARTGRHSLGEIRDLLGILREDDTDGSGRSLPSSSATLADLPALARGFGTAGLDVRLTSSGTRTDVPAGIELAAYRVIQEALTNSLRHAGARTAEVTVRYDPGAVEVEVVDDGTPSGPFAADRSPDADPYTSGHGLAGMRERVVIYGGTFRAGARSAGGSGVFARFPLERSAPPDPAAEPAPARVGGVGG